MIVRKTLIGVLSSAVLLGIGMVNAAPVQVRAAQQAAATIVGTLQPGFASTPGTTLTLKTRSGSTAVQVTDSTVLVRRYNAISALAEFQAGDTLYATGTMNPDHSITATAIKDLTIQAGVTDNVGTITAFTTDSAGAITQLKVRVGAISRRYSALTPFRPGQVVSITVDPAISLTLTDGTPAKLGDLLTSTNNNPIGLSIFTIGVYNRNSGAFGRIYRMRVLSPTPGTLTEVKGTLQQAPAATAAPTSLTLATRYGGVVTVAVDTSTALVRRFNGQSSLGELGAGDRIAVVGVYTGGSSYSAKLVKDLSIQRGYTFYGRIVTVNSSALTVQVLANNRLHPRDPIHIGDRVTVPLSANTIVADAAGHPSTTSSLHPGLRVVLMSVYDNEARTFTTADRVRIVG